MNPHSPAEQHEPCYPQDALGGAAAAALAGLGLPVPQRTDPSWNILEEAFTRALDHHRSAFAQAGRTADAGAVVRALAAGTFASGQRRDVNLWEDVALAALLAAGHERPVAVFKARFRESLSAWQQRYGRDAGPDLDDFLSELLTPRERSAPRIEQYSGKAPLGSWLRQVYLSICCKRRDAQASTPQSPSAADDGSDLLQQIPSRDGLMDDEFMRLDCREKLAPLIRQSMEALEARERYVLLAVTLDGARQRNLAQLLGVAEYKITRLKDAAVKKARAAFEDLSAQAGAGVRRCVELLLGRLSLT